MVLEGGYNFKTGPFWGADGVFFTSTKREKSEALEPTGS